MSAPFSFMETYCIDCGIEYDYNPSKPLGCSSLRCRKCRKKQTELNKKLILILLAGNGKAECRKCSYSRSSSPLRMVDATSHLYRATSQREREDRARRSQFVLCLNCLAEIDANEVEYKVSSTDPVQVEFYSRHVTVVKEKLKSVEAPSSDVIETEVVTDGPKTSRVVGEKKRIESGRTIDVPEM